MKKKAASQPALSPDLLDKKKEHAKAALRFGRVTRCRPHHQLMDSGRQAQKLR